MAVCCPSLPNSSLIICVYLVRLENWDGRIKVLWIKQNRRQCVRCNVYMQVCLFVRIHFEGLLRWQWFQAANIYGVFFSQFCSLHMQLFNSVSSSAKWMNHQTLPLSLRLLFACQLVPPKASSILTFMICRGTGSHVLVSEVVLTLRDAETLKDLFTPAGMIHCLGSVSRICGVWTRLRIPKLHMFLNL